MSSELQGLLPPGVASAACDGDLEAARLLPAEEPFMANAVPARRLEFATGRECARAALRSLGVPPAPIPADGRGAPRWPDGVVGSITHCDGLRAAAVAWRADLLSLGIDAEPNAPLPKGVLRRIAVDREAAALSRLRDADPTVCWDRLLFTVKEAVYKACYQLTRRPLNLGEVLVTFDAATRTFSARPSVTEWSTGARRIGELHGRWRTRDGLLVSAAIVPAPRSSGSDSSRRPPRRDL